MQIKVEVNTINLKLKEENYQNDVKMMKAMKDIPKFCAEVIYINQLKKKLDKLSEKLNNVMLDKVNEYAETKRIQE